MFSLVEDPWIKTASNRRISLLEAFSEESENSLLGGTPVEKFLAFRLLLAIAQAAVPLRDEDDWCTLSISKMSKKIRDYLLDHGKQFILDDPDHPFLQFPQLKSAKKEPLQIGGLVLGVSSGNAVVLTDGNMPHPLADADKVYVLLQQVILGFGGKKIDKSLCLNPKLKKSASAPPSTSLGRKGYLHSFVLGNSLLHTVLLNLMTASQLKTIPYLSEGVGVPPWEKMPAAEDDEIALQLSKSYMGHLIPMSRFCLIDGQNFYMTSGVTMPTLETGCVDLSMTVSAATDKKGGRIFKAIGADVSKQPWRQLDALLGFMATSKIWDCRQLSECLLRQSDEEAPRAGVWCVGLQVSFNSGEQFLTDSDGFVESEFRIDPDLDGSLFYNRYQNELNRINSISKIEAACISNYYADIGSKDVGNVHKEKALRDFWKIGDSLSVELEKCCETGEFSDLRKKIIRAAENIYNQHCPKESARQVVAWGKCRPHLQRFLKDKEN